MQITFLHRQPDPMRAPAVSQQ